VSEREREKERGCQLVEGAPAQCAVNAYTEEGGEGWVGGEGETETDRVGGGVGV
jgi:hypothetical protein